MPPMLSDDESDNSGPDVVPARVKADEKVTADKEDSEPEGEVEDDDEEDEDEYQVEKIMAHEFSGAQVFYHIKWLGYEDEADMTWEPVENLSGAKEILKAYHVSTGGTPEPPTKRSTKKGKGAGKRTVKDAALDSPLSAETGKKRGRKSDGNGASAKHDWMPLGLWDDEITCVMSIVMSVETKTTSQRPTKAESLEGCLEWKNGKKTMHSMTMLRKKCPQRLLDYYEQHIKFLD